MISIIIPAYNEEHYIENLLKCIQQQTWKDLEVIVADNHSQDNTREIARRYGAKVVDGGIPSVARNRGVEAAKGEFLLFIDADQEIASTFVVRILKKAKKYAIDICIPSLRPLDERKFIYLLLFRLHSLYLKIMQSIKPQGSGACIFSTMKIHKKIGGFNEQRRLSEDHDYIFRASRVGKFKVLREMHVDFSIRRLYEEGLWTSIYKITKAAMLHIFRGRADEKVKYEFGKFTK